MISRFPLNSKLGQTLKKVNLTLKDYTNSVFRYKNAFDKEEKKSLEIIIDKIKGEFREELGNYDKRKLEVAKLKQDFYYKYESQRLFDIETTSNEKEELNKEKLLSDIAKKEKAIEETVSNPIFSDAFEWRFEFPEVLDTEGGYVGFDVVIGNPPYGVKFDKEKDFINKNYQANNDIFTLFIERGTSIIKQKSFLSFIIPIFWQTGDNYLPSRKFISQNIKLEKGLILPYDVFADAYVDTGIYVFQKEFSENYKSLVYEFDPKFKLNESSLSEVQFTSLESSKWVTSKTLKISFNETEDFKSKIFQNSVFLSDISKSTRGILATSDDISNEKIGENYKPFFTGKLTRYECENAFQFVKYGDNLKEKPKFYDFFEGERILIRRIISRQFRVMATLSNQEFVNKKDLYNLILSNPKFNINYVLGIINSKLVSYLKVKGSASAKKDDFTQLTLNDIREIPIKDIPEIEQAPIIKLVEQILTAKQSTPSVSTAELEALIDKLVYVLYGLTGEEIEIIEQSIK